MQAKKNLEDALASSSKTKLQYQGRDRLCLSAQQIKSVSPESITTPDDVILILKNLENDEIRSVLSDAKLIEKEGRSFRACIINSIQDISGFFTILYNLGDQQIGPFIQGIGGKAITKFVKHNGEAFANGLNYLSDSKFSEFIDAINTTDYRFTSSNFLEIRGALSSVSKDKLFLDKMYPKLLDIMTNIYDFKNIIKGLPEEKISDFLKLCQDKLLTLPKSPYDLVNLINFLSSANREIVFELFKNKNKFLELTTSADGFIIFMDQLPDPKKLLYFDLIKDKLPELTKTPEDVALIIQSSSLSVEQRLLYFEKVPAELIKITKSASNFIQILTVMQESRLKNQFLQESKELKSVSDAAAISIPEKTKSESIDIKYFYLMENKLMDLTTTSEDFAKIMKVLPPNEKVRYFSLARDNFFVLINNAQDFKNIMEALDEAQKRVCYESVKTHLVKLISLHSVSLPSSFVSILEQLNVQQRELFCELIDSKLIIASIIYADQFKAITEILPDKQINIYFELIQDKLIDLTKDGRDFHCIMTSKLSDPQKEIYFDKILNKLFNLTSNSTDFDYIFSNLSPKQNGLYFEKVKDKLIGITSSSSNFGFITKKLSETQNNYYFDKIKNKLITFIRGFSNEMNEFGYIFKLLEPLQKNEFFKMMKENLDGWTKTRGDDRMLHYDYRKAVTLFTILDSKEDKSVLKDSELHDAYFDIIKMRLPALITDIYAFSAIMRALSKNERAECFELFKDILPEFLVSAFRLPRDMMRILLVLELDQRKIFIDKILNKELYTSSNWSYLLSEYKDFVATGHAPPTFISSIFDNIKEFLLASMKETTDYITLSDYLPKNELLSFYEAAKSKLLQFATDDKYFFEVEIINRFLSSIPSEKRWDFLISIQDQLQRQDIKILVSILKNPDLEQKSEFIDIMLSCVDRKSLEPIKDIMSALGEPLDNLFFAKVKENLFSLMKTNNDYETIMEMLEHHPDLKSEFLSDLSTRTQPENNPFMFFKRSAGGPEVKTEKEGKEVKEDTAKVARTPSKPSG
ncbi:MAG: hypothetical protein ABI597_13360 [Gammaproteobacteria bacterium]